MKKAKGYFITAAGLALLAAGLCMMKFWPQTQWIMKSVPSLCIGIGCGMFGHGLGDIFTRKAFQKDPALARQKEIEVNDERNVAHSNASKAKGFTMMTYVFAALMLSYALMGAAPEFLLPLVIAYLFVQFYAVYHRIQLDKTQ